ncbi:MAG: HlyD family secretion protein [Deltaproteobacteria bacterium]|nr:HlyD family secretion protein [Deltaproteobacteria bacterium]
MGRSGEVQNNQKRKLIAISLFSVIVIMGIIAISMYLEYRKTHITTDDAFVDGRIHVIASKVPGTVKTIYVRDNEFVGKGKLLADIDDRDYIVRVEQAESTLNAERAKLRELSTTVDVATKRLSEVRFGIESAAAQLRLQEANFKQAEQDLTRARRLFAKHIMPEEQFEKTKTGYDIAVARLEAAKDQQRQAEASRETQKAVIIQAKSAFQSQKSKIKQKEAILKAEKLQRSYTKIYAPSEGYLTKKTVEIGNQIQAGQPLMAVVPLNNIWIKANYKETQLEHIKPGQEVKIKVDTYPGKAFFGRVESIMAGTGSVFSLFPPENATGNYVKIVQRIPVKIILKKGTDPDHIFRIGMSVVPTILVK